MHSMTPASQHCLTHNHCHAVTLLHFRGRAIVRDKSAVYANEVREIRVCSPSLKESFSARCACNTALQLPAVTVCRPPSSCPLVPFSGKLTRAYREPQFLRWHLRWEHTSKGLGRRCLTHWHTQWLSHHPGARSRAGTRKASERHCSHLFLHHVKLLF